ncbi:hypothetical protein Sjap_009438 [Stephania japonica]|uniref:Uncharacterized protein n=1 Tax=Stephania japonica TaxID=461633 RepID=A0AAP0JS54_9MAGN
MEVRSQIHCQHLKNRGERSQTLHQYLENGGGWDKFDCHHKTFVALHKCST